MNNFDSSEINILDAYIQKYKQFIILILGKPCSNKSEIAKELVIDLKIPSIKINDYLLKDKYIEKEVDGIKFKLYEDPENFNWKKLDKDVNNIKSTGVILYGNFLDLSKISFTIDYALFFNMNTTLCKKILIEKKLLPYENNNEKVKIYFEKIFNPLYDNIKKNIIIHKFYNIKEKTTFDEIYDNVFDIIMEFIKSKIYNTNKKIKN
jgi:hypothetical protein